MIVIMIIVAALQVGGVTYFNSQTKEVKHVNRYERAPIVHEHQETYYTIEVQDIKEGE